MYVIRFVTSFRSSYKVIIKAHQEVEKRTEKTLRLLRIDPFYPSLKSHKVNTRNFGEKWSSRITGDIRIIWDFDEKEKQIIILFAIAKHSGSHREYK